MMNELRIISLGEIVTQDIRKTIQAFTTLVAKKKESDDYKAIGAVIGGVLHKNMNLIDKVKWGQLSEDEFTEKMIAAIADASGIRLSIEEFDEAWNVMNPKFIEFKDLLFQAIEYNKRPHQKMIFISFTNPKDMKHLMGELEKNGMPYVTLRSGELVEIGGIELCTTYATKKTKAELIQSKIEACSPKPAAYSPKTSKSLLASSLDKTLSMHAKEPEPLNIKYVRGVNGIDDPVLKADFEKVNEAVEEKAKEFQVDTIIWQKSGKLSLLEALSNSESRPIAVSKL